MQPLCNARAILLAGPTACGKSALAVRIAEAVNGEVVNADSMQVYGELRILTARPDPSDMGGGGDGGSVAHHLYGGVSAREAFSVGAWLTAALPVIKSIMEVGKLPIITGGTGLYFHCLMGGLAKIPAIPADIRQAVRAGLTSVGAGESHRRLAEIDPAAAERIRPADPQRIARALEVFVATGRPLSAWQETPAPPLISGQVACIALTMPRAQLATRISRRLEGMVAEGVLQEVADLAAMKLPPDLPAMKAVGLAPLMAHLDGSLALEAALSAAAGQTRQFAKRQETWLRRKIIAWNRVEKKETGADITEILSIIQKTGLTRRPAGR